MKNRKKTWFFFCSLLVCLTFHLLINALIVVSLFLCDGFIFFIFVVTFYGFLFLLLLYAFLIYNVVVFYCWLLIFFMVFLFEVIQIIFMYTVVCITFYWLMFFSDLLYFFVFWIINIYIKLCLLFVLFSGDIKKLRKHFKNADRLRKKYLFTISGQEAFNSLWK